MSRELGGDHNRRSGSFGRINSWGSSTSRLPSFRLSGAVHPQPVVGLEGGHDILSAVVDDNGDRVVQSGNHSSVRISFDHVSENNVVLQSMSLEIKTLSNDAVLQPEDKAQEAGEKQWERWRALSEDGSHMIHLAFFAILGVISRYLLQKLFGPGVINATSDKNILYPDIFSNMVGSFLMGWLGIVFKGDISEVSDQLAVGLSTGYLGSLTTFSGWNQAMLNLSFIGRWALSVMGFWVSLLLCYNCIELGVLTAQGFRSLNLALSSCLWCCNKKWITENYRYHLFVFPVLITVWITLLVLSLVLELKEFKNGGGEAQLWLACLVAAPGVWIRWGLSRRFNGTGLWGFWKWLPFGTLIANVSASIVMAALAKSKEKHNTQNWITVASGIQLGFLGCLSTVSTFVSEYRGMKRNSNPSWRWRADAYASVTIMLSFLAGTLASHISGWALR